MLLYKNIVIINDKNYSFKYTMVYLSEKMLLFNINNNYLYICNCWVILRSNRWLLYMHNLFSLNVGTEHIEYAFQ